MHRDDIEHPGHGGHVEALIGFLAGIQVTRRALPDSLLGCDEKVFIKWAERDLRWIPAGRDVTDNSAFGDIDNPNCVDTSFSHVETRGSCLLYTTYAAEQ